MNCKYKDAKCFKCGKLGHTSSACRSTKRGTDKQKQLEEDGSSESENTIFGIEENESVERAMLKVNINKATVLMEVDTGAAVTIIPKGICKLNLKKSSRRLKSVTGQAVKLAGQTKVKVKIGRITKYLTRYVAEDKNSLSLLGRDWIKAFFGNGWIRRLTKNVIASVNNTEKPVKLKRILDKYSDTVFKPGLGELKEIKAQLHLKPEAQPRFYKPREVPFAVKPRLEKALEEMVEEGNLERVGFSHWGTPMVPVVKPNGMVRVCGDYKVTLNPCLEVPQYPLPRAEECFHAMNGGKHFTKINVAQAYNQVTLDEESRDLTTINTHKGLYRWTRLPYGVASSPAIFQEIMDKILQGLHQVV